jgi:transcriptional regulator of acetoin/glycerol metabolism
MSPTRHETTIATADTERPYTSLQTLDRAMLMLEALAEQPMRAKQLATQLGLEWTTLHRTLAHLRERC